MAWVNETTNLIKIDDAKRRGFDVWELWLSNWGNVGATFDGNSLSFPNTLTNPGINLNGVFAAAIAPASTVDRCQLVWNSGNPLDTSLTQWPYYATECSVRAPARWALPGGVLPYTLGGGNVPCLQINAEAFRNLTLLSADNYISQSNAATLFGDTYYPAGSSTLAPWGLAMPNTAFVAPQLRLLVWLRPPGEGLPTSRYPVAFRRSFDISSPTPETRIVFPVHGRRHVNVRARIRTSGADTGPFDISVGSVVNTHTSSAFDPVTPVEILLTTTTGVTAATAFNVTYSNQELGFLTIWLNRSGGTDADVTVIITAED